MAYCSQDDLLKMIPEAELAELTAESGDIPDPVVVAEAIAKADGEIDSYLAVRYSLPLVGHPGPDKILVGGHGPVPPLFPAQRYAPGAAAKVRSRGGLFEGRWPRARPAGGGAGGAPA